MSFDAETLIGRSWRSNRIRSLPPWYACCIFDLFRLSKGDPRVLIDLYKATGALTRVCASTKLKMGPGSPGAFALHLETDWKACWRHERRRGGDKKIKEDRYFLIPDEKKKKSPSRDSRKSNIIQLIVWWRKGPSLDPRHSFLFTWTMGARKKKKEREREFCFCPVSIVDYDEVLTRALDPAIWSGRGGNVPSPFLFYY